MKKHMFALFLAAALALGAAGCCTTRHADGITQIATIDALLAGVYDGEISLRELRRYGDFGIGTFAALDGEMILLDGQFYQIRADGKVYRPGPETLTPFACVTPFIADRHEALAEPLDMTAFERLVNARVPQGNRFVAFIVRGEFKHVRTRSVPAQRKPYPPLAEVAKTQPVFDMANRRGTLVGFRSPPFVKGVNVPGFHIHFLADDHTGGGHVLGFEMNSGKLEMDTGHQRLTVLLPGNISDFYTADLATDRSAELHAVEK